MFDSDSCLFVQEIFCQIEIPRPLQAERENSGAADGDAVRQQYYYSF